MNFAVSGYRSAILVMGAVTLTTSGPMFAKNTPELPLKRQGAWTMDYADNACHLSASFGKGDSAVTARFTQVAPQDSIRLTLIGARFASSLDLISRAQFAFVPASAKPDWFQITNGTFPQSGVAVPAVFLNSIRLDNLRKSGQGVSDLPSVSIDTENAVNGLSVRVWNAKPFMLDLVSMGPPMAAMRLCTDDLVRSWGYDPDEIATRQARAKPTRSPAMWANASEYPVAMLSKGTSAKVNFRLTINESGVVTDCDVLETTSPASIGPYTCDIIRKHASFKPSLNKDGQPARDFYINSVFWQMT